MLSCDGYSIAKLLLLVCGRGEDVFKAGKSKLRTVGVEACSGVSVFGIRRRRFARERRRRINRYHLVLGLFGLSVNPAGILHQ
jgi:hypothetical protein